MKAVFFDYNINFGGAPKGSVSLCSQLMKSGEDIIIYDVYGKNEKYINLINEKKIKLHVVLPEAKKIYIGGKNKIKRLINIVLWTPEFIKIIFLTRAALKKDCINLVWVNNEKSLITIVLATIGLPVKRVLYHRGWAKHGSIGLLARIIINRHCDGLIGHSRATVENLKSLFPKKKHYYVPNSVDLQSKPCTLIGIPEKSEFIILLPAARPVHEKGHHTAVLALAKLVEQGMCNVVMHFPGEIAVGASNEYITHLKALIKKLNLTEKVKFVGWLDSLEDAIQQADVVILPSHTEGFPRVIIESMLLLTPVIATPVGGIPEAVLNNKTGLIVNVEDEGMLADAISSIILEPSNGERMALNAYEFAKTNFSITKQLAGVKNAFKETLTNDSKRAK